VSIRYRSLKWRGYFAVRRESRRLDRPAVYRGYSRGFREGVCAQGYENQKEKAGRH
jgi:hypothetical protein